MGWRTEEPLDLLSLKFKSLMFGMKDQSWFIMVDSFYKPLNYHVWSEKNGCDASLLQWLDPYHHCHLQHFRVSAAIEVPRSTFRPRWNRPESSGYISPQSPICRAVHSIWIQATESSTGTKMENPYGSSLINLPLSATIFYSYVWKPQDTTAN